MLKEARRSAGGTDSVLLSSQRQAGASLKGPNGLRAPSGCGPGRALAIARHCCQAQTHTLSHQKAACIGKNSPQVWSGQSLACKLPHSGGK